MAYGPRLAAALSGATVEQLGYWRRPRKGRSPLLVPEISAERPVLYSFRDLLALRMFVQLRQRFSLQKIRKAVDTVHDHERVEHLSEYSLVGDRSSIYFVEENQATDVLRRPGQKVIMQAVDVLKPFIHEGREIPHLLHPNKYVEVNTAIRSGDPVIVGTRVPYSDVADLMYDGLEADEVPEYFPSVAPEAARGALKFAKYVDSYPNRSDNPKLMAA